MADVIDYKEQHDMLISQKPSDMSQADFDQLIEEHKAECSFCNSNLDTGPKERGDNMGENFTQEDVDAAVEAAVAPVQTELDGLKAFLGEAEEDERVAAVKADYETQVNDLKAELDAAKNEAGAAKDELESTLQFFADLQELADLHELYEARKEQRKADVADAASFTEEYIDENIDRWAAMSDEDFAAVVADWRAIPSKAAEEGSDENEDYRSTAMQGVRPSGGSASVSDDLADLLAAQKHGFNIKRLR